MNPAKLSFLQNKFIPLLKSIPEGTAPAFGKMNLWQMVEHMSDSFRIANGKDKHDIITPEERLKPMKDFVMSEKDFRPNTPNALLSDTPAPCRNVSLEMAISELEKEILDFVNHFLENPGSTITNPFFGHLNYEEWVQLLHKHALHHLRQFGIDTIH